MSSPLRSPISAAMMIGGGAVAIVGVILLGTDHRLLGVCLALIGLAIEMSGASVHDFMHRRRGEQPHAMWGIDDHNRPRFLGGPRS